MGWWNLKNRVNGGRAEGQKGGRAKEAKEQGAWGKGETNCASASLRANIFVGFTNIEILRHKSL